MVVLGETFDDGDVIPVPLSQSFQIIGDVLCHFFDWGQVLHQFHDLEKCLRLRSLCIVMDGGHGCWWLERLEENVLQEKGKGRG